MICCLVLCFLFPSQAEGVAGCVGLSNKAHLRLVQQSLYKILVKTPLLCQITLLRLPVGIVLCGVSLVCFLTSRRVRVFPVCSFPALFSQRSPLNPLIDLRRQPSTSVHHLLCVKSPNKTLIKSVLTSVSAFWVQK